MDPLAHTLAGATLAETGLKRVTPLATATLLVAANLPDVDALAMLTSDASTTLGLRRGWTHGLLAQALLPWALAGAMLAFDSAWRRRRAPASAPARFLPLLGLSYLGVLSHPLLDWLNTYGVRLLMPFSERWFYGDAVFIVDPWMWLLGAAAVVLARSAGLLARAGWLLLALATSALVLLPGVVPPVGRALWALTLLGLGVARWRLGPGGRVEGLARGCAVALVLYTGGMVALSRAAEGTVRRHLEGQGVVPETLAAEPPPAHPLRREVLVQRPEAWRAYEVPWPGGPVRESRPAFPRQPLTPAVRAALAAPQVEGNVRWLRFPVWRQVRLPEGGVRVEVDDARYAWAGERGLGSFDVELDAALRPTRVQLEP